MAAALALVPLGRRNYSTFTCVLSDVGGARWGGRRLQALALRHEVRQEARHDVSTDHRAEAAHFGSPRGGRCDALGRGRRSIDCVCRAIAVSVSCAQRQARQRPGLTGTAGPSCLRHFRGASVRGARHPIWAKRLPTHPPVVAVDTIQNWLKATLQLLNNNYGSGLLDVDIR